jgi:hypothetical protein
MHPVGKTRRWSRVTIATLLLGAMFAQNHVDAAEGSLETTTPSTCAITYVVVFGAVK